MCQCPCKERHTILFLNPALLHNYAVRHLEVVILKTKLKASFLETCGQSHSIVEQGNPITCQDKAKICERSVTPQKKNRNFLNLSKNIIK